MGCVERKPTRHVRPARVDPRSDRALGYPGVPRVFFAAGQDLNRIRQPKALPESHQGSTANMSGEATASESPRQQVETGKGSTEVRIRASEQRRTPGRSSDSEPETPGPLTWDNLRNARLDLTFASQQFALLPRPSHSLAVWTRYGTFTNR